MQQAAALIRRSFFNKNIVPDGQASGRLSVCSLPPCLSLSRSTARPFVPPSVRPFVLVNNPGRRSVGRSSPVPPSRPTVARSPSLPLSLPPYPGFQFFVCLRRRQARSERRKQTGGNATQRDGDEAGYKSRPATTASDRGSNARVRG